MEVLHSGDVEKDTTHPPDPEPDPQPGPKPGPVARRTPAVRLRTAAAGSLLAAASVAGMGGAVQLPAQRGGVPALEAAPQVQDNDGAVRARLAGVQSDLANAVAWGTVTQVQAERFYAQIAARIQRGQ